MTIIDKREPQVEAMFNGIAKRYDLLNHILSFGIDKLWRKRLVRELLKSNPQKVLDVATGTADLAITLAHKHKELNITGVDIAQGMLEVARIKLDRMGLKDQIELQYASAERLPFADNSFDAAMVAFGARNFENTLKGLSEICRVIKPNGSINILEFSTPSSTLVRVIYRFYFSKILPFVGRLVSGHKTAYTYLPISVDSFKEREEFIELLRLAGFVNAKFTMQSFGVAAIYIAIKPLGQHSYEE